MTAGGKKVDAQIFNIHRNVKIGLNCVGVEGYLFLSANRPDFFDRLNCTYFIVGMHYTD